MFFKINNVFIQSILSVVPKKKNLFLKNNPLHQRIKKVLGVENSYRSSINLTTVDLFEKASTEILKKNLIKKNNIKCLICVTQTPDYLMPSCSNIIHQKLKLGKDCIAFDINMGCSGYVYGLWVISMIIKECKGHGLLLVGDTISKTINRNDISNKLLFGDGVSATLLKKKAGNVSYFELGSGDCGFDKLVLKGTGFRDKKKLSEFYMDGKEVFSFALSEVPSLVKRIIGKSRIKLDKNDYIIFHQANKMMLNKIYDEVGVNNKKRLFSINNFGNTSSSSIPITICKFKYKKINKCVLTGFGAGFSYAACIVFVKKTKIHKTIFYDKRKN
jgi:3-oxoacyl-[acyl-carrier-protein] synthase-3